MGRKFILDIDEDRAALSVMHVYMFARGVHPDVALKERDEDTPARQAWLDKAQALADNPDKDCHTGSVLPETFEDFPLSNPGYEIAGAIMRAKPGLFAQRDTNNKESVA